MKKTDLYLKPGTYIKANSAVGDIQGISLENFVVSVLNNPTCCAKPVFIKDGMLMTSTFLSATLQTVKDQGANLSPLQLSTTSVQVNSTFVVNSTTTPLNTAFVNQSTATIVSSNQNVLRVLRTGGQPCLWIGTANEVPDASNFLMAIRTGAWFNTATPTLFGGAAYYVNRGNAWGPQTTATGLRIAHLFTCNMNNGRSALSINPLLTETSTNTDYVAVNNLLVATAGVIAPPSARVQIIGDGSTQATNSLLVQNSSGTQLGYIDDLGQWQIGTGTNGGFSLDINGGSARIKNSNLYFDSPGDAVIVGRNASSTEHSRIILRSSSHGGIELGTQFSIGIIAFQTGIGAYNERMRIDQNGNIGIGTTTTSGAKTTIKGSGSTSATTSLLVQNSSGTAALTVKDDLSATFGGKIIVGNPGYLGHTVSIQGSIYFDGSNNGIKFQDAVTGITDNGTGSMLFTSFLDRYVFSFAYANKGLLIQETNSGSLNSSAHLQVDSTTQGFLPPRMTTTQKNAITTPAAGLVIYDSTLNKLCVRTASAWETITSV